jgi:ferrous iron transport protein B
MPPRSAGDALQVALIGNPNTGKSTLFSALVGIHQRVGNYPGVTVEKRIGACEIAGRGFSFIDLPGLYSLSPRSRDELVAVEVLLGHFRDTSPVDAILCIVDASNLERNLYLVSQVLELRLPTIVVLNMLDVAEKHGTEVDPERLAERLGLPVISTQANRGIGLGELREALGQIDVAQRPASPDCFPAEFDEETVRLGSLLAVDRETAIPGWLTQRILLDTTGIVQDAVLPSPPPRFREELAAARQRLAQAGCPVPRIETLARYDWARDVLDGVVTQSRQRAPTVSDRVDRVLTHRVGGMIIFVLVVVMLFQAVFVWAEPFMSAIGDGSQLLGHWLETRLAEGTLQSLLIDGVLGGVGAVLAFLPQILVLFLFLGVLEDCGYLARAAYLMDGLMVRVGLSGKSFLPLLSSFACAVPGIMATRVIENPRDRLTTILVAPLITCSARLPVFALLIAAFIPQHKFFGGLLNLQGLTLASLYLLGIVAAVVVARLLKKTILRGDAPPFLMELPTYKWPSVRTVVLRVVERVYSFVRLAGTVILAVSIVVWAALYYPHDRETVEGPYKDRRTQLQSQLDRLGPGDPNRDQATGELAAIEREIAGAYQKQSYLGRFGHWIEPIFRPLGWDWRIGSAVIASFPAREVVVATLGVIFSGGQSDAESPEQASEFGERLREARWEGTERPLFSVPVALSIMVFFALCAQCAATLAVIRQETNSWRWPIFAVTYMTALAYLGAMATYQIGTWIGG